MSATIKQSNKTTFEYFFFIFNCQKVQPLSIDGLSTMAWPRMGDPMGTFLSSTLFSMARHVGPRAEWGYSLALCTLYMHLCPKYLVSVFARCVLSFGAHCWTFGSAYTRHKWPMLCLHTLLQPTQIDKGPAFITSLYAPRVINKFSSPGRSILQVAMLWLTDGLILLPCGYGCSWWRHDLPCPCFRFLECFGYKPLPVSNLPCIIISSWKVGTMHVICTHIRLYTSCVGRNTRDMLYMLGAHWHVSISTWALPFYTLLKILMSTFFNFFGCFTIPSIYSRWRFMLSRITSNSPAWPHKTCQGRLYWH